MDLLKSTLNLMKTRQFSITELCADLDISQRWYYQFRRGEVNNPGVRTIQAMHDYLSEMPKKKHAA